MKSRFVHHIPYQAIETTLFDGCGHDGRLVIESYDRARNLARKPKATEACFVVFNLWKGGRLRFDQALQEVFALREEGLQIQVIALQVAPGPWPADIAENIDFRLNENPRWR